MEMNIAVESTRNREVERIVSILERPSTISQAWVGIERIARVERFGTRAGQPFNETVFYIGSGSPIHPVIIKSYLNKQANSFSRKEWKLLNP
jgi:hypothetical protein